MTADFVDGRRDVIVPFPGSAGLSLIVRVKFASKRIPKVRHAT